MANRSGVRISGPLAAHVDAFEAELARLGYTSGSASHQLRLLAHLSGWLEQQDRGPTLDREDLARFVATRRAEGRRPYVSMRGIAPLTEFLGEVGLLGPEEAGAPTDVELFVDRYRAYLRHERGVTDSSIRTYLSALRPFLARRVIDGQLELEAVTAADVTTFLLEVSQRGQPGLAQSTATALRSLLAFLHLEGITERSLVGAVPSVASWRLSTLPRALEPGEVTRLLRACDRRTHVGRRDAAMLSLLVRLGLRAAEVAALQLDDIDWRAGELVVHSKGGRDERVPIPTDVGRAIVAYLQQGRPANALTRHLFIRIDAPLRGLTSQAVSERVCAAAERAGMEPIRAHRLRHTAATSMLAAGAPLIEIGQLLRHRKALTTAIYAKTDVEALRAIARPWPGGGA
jgi:integrase/recombinase XerD